jgi:putative transposase
MKTNTIAPDYKGYRFPPEIISHAVWLYFRFSLSFRDVEELLAQRGIVVSYETVRQWCLKFGQTYANELCTTLRHRDFKRGPLLETAEVG